MSRKRNYKGYVNHSHATPKHIKKKQTELFGNHYASRVFSMNENITESNFKDKSLPIGTLHLAGKEIELTEYEINKLIKTLENSLAIHDKKIMLGL
jgi:hypothetical protein